MYGGKFAFQNWLGLLAVGRKFTIFALFYFEFEGKFQVQAPRGAYIGRGNLTEGFLRNDFGELIFGGAYTWRSLVSEFYSNFLSPVILFFFCFYFISVITIPEKKKKTKRKWDKKITTI